MNNIKIEFLNEYHFCQRSFSCRYNSSVKLTGIQNTFFSVIFYISILAEMPQKSQSGNRELIFLAPCLIRLPTGLKIMNSFRPQCKFFIFFHNDTVLVLK